MWTVFVTVIAFAVCCAEFSGHKSLILSTDVVIRDHYNNEKVRRLEILEDEDPFRAIRSFCRENRVPLCGDCQQLFGAVNSMLSSRPDQMVPNFEDAVVKDIWLSYPGYATFAVDLEDVSASGRMESLLLQLPTDGAEVEATVMAAVCESLALPPPSCGFLTGLLHMKLKRWQGETVTRLDHLSCFLCDRAIRLSVEVEADKGRKWAVLESGPYPDDSLEHFCQLHSLSRRQCLAVTMTLGAFVRDWHGYSGELGGQDLFFFTFVLETLEAIMAKRQSVGSASLLSGAFSSSAVPQHPASTPAPLDVDFIEIGTSNMNTASRYVDEGEEVVGFAVEPSALYLEQVAVKTGVRKVNAAISAHSRHIPPEQRSVDFYWIPQQTILDEGLPANLVGQNSIDAFHPSHITMNLTHLVRVDTVPLLPIDTFLELYHIRKVQLLKIDTEGHDVVILKGLFEYLLEREEMYCPAVIIFESNALTSQEDVAEVLRLFVGELGYVVRYSGLDTVLVRDTAAVASVHGAKSPS